MPAGERAVSTGSLGTISFFPPALSTVRARFPPDERRTLSSPPETREIPTARIAKAQLRAEPHLPTVAPIGPHELLVPRTQIGAQTFWAVRVEPRVPMKMTDGEAPQALPAAIQADARQQQRVLPQTAPLGRGDPPAAAERTRARGRDGPLNRRPLRHAPPPRRAAARQAFRRVRARRLSNCQCEGLRSRQPASRRASTT